MGRNRAANGLPTAQLNPNTHWVIRAGAGARAMVSDRPRAIAFGVLTRYGPRVSLLGLAMARGRSLGTIAAGGMSDAEFGVYAIPVPVAIRC